MWEGGWWRSCFEGGMLLKAEGGMLLLKLASPSKTKSSQALLFIPVSDAGVQPSITIHAWPRRRVRVQCCFTSTETIRTVREGATSTFTQLLSSSDIQVQCCMVKSTETRRTTRDGKPRTATSTFTQFLRSDSTS